MTDLEAIIAPEFAHLSTPALIARMEAAPDFDYDDETVELNRRLRAQGKTWRWTGGFFNPRIEIVPLAAEPNPLEEL